MKINPKGLAVISLLSFLVMIVINMLAVFQPLNGVETGDVSDRYYNLFTPAGFTFSIWSIIYILLLVFVISRLIYAFKEDARAKAHILPYFILSCLANASWLVAWHHDQLWIGVAIMTLLLLCLLLIHFRERIPYSWKPAGEKIMVDIPFSIYLGWISVALVANISAALVQSGSGLQEHAEKWAIGMVILATLLAMLAGAVRRNIFYALTIAWGLFGILKARQLEGETPTLVKVITGCVIIILISAVVSGLRRVRKDPAL